MRVKPGEAEGTMVSSKSVLAKRNLFTAAFWDWQVRAKDRYPSEFKFCGRTTKNCQLPWPRASASRWMREGGVKMRL